MCGVYGRLVRVWGGWPALGVRRLRGFGLGVRRARAWGGSGLAGSALRESAVVSAGERGRVSVLKGQRALYW